jgi:hypothetical protein
MVSTPAKLTVSQEDNIKMDLKALVVTMQSQFIIGCDNWDSLLKILSVLLQQITCT